MLEKHLFTLPMDKQGHCGRCGRSCIDEVHISHDEYVALLKQQDEKRSDNINSEAK